MSDFHDLFHVRWLFTFSNQSGIINEVQNLMEESFCAATDTSSNIDADGMVSFYSQSRFLDIDDAHSFDIILLFTLLNNVDQILCLTDWLIIMTASFSVISACYKIYWIININLLETFQMFKIPHSWHYCVVAWWSACNHWQVIAKVNLAQFFKISLKLFLVCILIEY